MTAIHDFGFRGYDGDREGGLSRVFAISASELRRVFKSKRFLVFFAICISPAIIAFVMVWMRFIVIEGQGQLVGFGGGRGARAGGFFGRQQLSKPDFFFDNLQGGATGLIVIFSAVVGAGVIARDRAAGALEIYFTRGIGPWQYFAGKLGSVWFLLLCQVLFGFLAVWMFAVGVAPADSGYFGETIKFIPRLIVGQALFCLTLATWLTCLSTSTDSTRFALIRWVGILAAMRLVGGVLRRELHDPDWMLLSPYHVVRRIAAGISGATPSEMTLSHAWIVWGGLTVAALWWARRNLRPVEVVG